MIDRIVKFGKDGEIEKEIILNPNNCLGASSFEDGIQSIKKYLDELKKNPNVKEKCGTLNVMQMFWGIENLLRDKKDFVNLLEYIGVTLEEFDNWAKDMGDSVEWYGRFKNGK
jgi:hypothetical protein